MHRKSAWCLTILLILQTVLLSWSAFSNSPVVDEIAHLPAGLSHWRYRTFDLYRVNPPLIRSVAAIPVLFSDCVEDWNLYQSTPLEREEFRVGRAFVSANSYRFFHYVSLARLACIPFCWLGTLACHHWARELSGRRAGLFAATAWVVSPNILAHGALITPDAGAAALGLLAAWLFWRWLRLPNWPRTVTAGIALGAAELSKTTWLILFGLWPLIFFVAFLSKRNVRLGLRQFWRLAVSLLIALYVLNAGYSFDGSMQRLGDYQFKSETLSGHPAVHSDQKDSGNRFAGTVFQSIPVPLPRSYVEGIDLQKFDFDLGQPSYLRGEWRDRGWWYYYLYALAVKVPAGILIIAAMSILVAAVSCRSDVFRARTLALILPPLTILVLVSCQTGFNKHLRYVLAVLPFVFVMFGATFGRLRSRSLRRLRPVWIVLLMWSAVSSFRSCPISLSYFNEFAGGPSNGYKHLLGSNLDWGQSLIALKKWNDARTDQLPLFVNYSGLFDPADAGFACQPFRDPDVPLPRGWYVFSLNRLYGQEEYSSVFRLRPPDRVLDHSMAIYLVD